MKQSFINTIPPSQGIGYLQPSNMILSLSQEEKTLEGLLRDKIASMRMNDENLQTHWDNQLSYLLSSALANYEMERVGGVTFANEEF